MSTTLNDDALAAAAAAFHRSLLELKRVYQFRDRDRICCHDISVTQCWALEAVRRLGALTLNELAAELYIDKSTASRVVGALERKGYLRRAPHPDDGRALKLEATPEGVALFRRIEADLLEQERRLLAQFAPEVRAAMIELVGQLAEAAERCLIQREAVCCPPG